MSALELLGVAAADVAALTHDSPEYPEPVAGRVAHIDADLMAYQVSAESKAELNPMDPTPRKTLEDMKHNAAQACLHVMKLAGATRAVLHTTNNSNKGGRPEQAILKEYQANRKNKVRPENLDDIRDWLAVGCQEDCFEGRNHTIQEADDGLAQAIYADRENAILCSADKDLLMVPGLKLDMQTYVVSNQEDDFGFIEIKETKSAKKLVGRGTKFFWAQMLMGDPADNISGIPLLDVNGKAKKCGPVQTYATLAVASSDKECYHIVKTAFETLEKEHGYEYRHWKTGRRVTATKAMFSEMQLLWMRRKPSATDVLDWLMGVVTPRLSNPSPF